MNSILRIFFMGLWIFGFLSCNNKERQDSPYADILYRQPFAALTDSIESQPGNDELWFNRAVLLNKNNFPEPALADFKKAWELRKDERYAVGISRILMDKQTDSALYFIKDALKEFPKSLFLQLNLARIFNEQGDTEKAFQTTHEILIDHPEQVDVLKMQADLLDLMQKKDSAILVLERAYQLAPFDIDLNYALAYKYAENKNAKVIALCDSLIRMDSLNTHAEPHYYKGIYYSNVGDHVKALVAFDKAVQNDYTYLNGYIEKGRVQYELKRYADALKTFALANTISPKFPDAWFWMARTQEAMGNKEDAKLNYQRALGLDPAFEEAKERLEGLK